MSDLHRTGFHSLRGRFDWDHLPLRLFAKGNARFWNPADIDFTQDARDWAGLTDAQRENATYLVAMFVAGEEAVTEDIQPFMKAMAAEGRIGDEMYLTQFAFEEARHTEVFRRWMDAVGLTEDLHAYVADNPGYRRIFYEELPESLRRLDDDHGPAAQIRASVTYNHIVEGTLALTGYYAWNKVCKSHGILPGMQELVRRIGDDERRHMAWGTFTCRRHVAADDSNWDAVTQRMGELVPHALGAIQWVLDHVDPTAFDLEVTEFVSYAGDRAQRRLGAIESARGADVARIDLDYTPERLEDQFGDEDAAQLARL